MLHRAVFAMKLHYGQQRWKHSIVRELSLVLRDFWPKVSLANTSLPSNDALGPLERAKMLTRVRIRRIVDGHDLIAALITSYIQPSTGNKFSRNCSTLATRSCAGTSGLTSSTISVGLSQASNSGKNRAYGERGERNKDNSSKPRPSPLPRPHAVNITLTPF
jgi:hypothetical protein